MDHLGLCLAIALGVAITMWVAMDNAILGFTIGAGVGIALWTWFGAKRKDDDGSNDQVE